jgi:hypothetical protein
MKMRGVGISFSRAISVAYRGTRWLKRQLLTKKAPHLWSARSLYAEAGQLELFGPTPHSVGSGFVVLLIEIAKIQP